MTDACNMTAAEFRFWGYLIIAVGLCVQFGLVYIGIKMNLWMLPPVRQTNKSGDGK